MGVSFDVQSSDIKSYTNRVPFGGRSVDDCLATSLELLIKLTLTCDGSMIFLAVSVFGLAPTLNPTSLQLPIENINIETTPETSHRGHLPDVYQWYERGLRTSHMKNTLLLLTGRSSARTTHWRPQTSQTFQIDDMPADRRLDLAYVETGDGNNKLSYRFVAPVATALP